MKNLLEIKNQITELAEVIAAVVVKHSNPIEDEISERKAKRDFRSRWITYHNERNNIKWTRKGACKNSPKITSRSALIALRKAEQLHTKSIIKGLTK